ncbi:hypothetical protein B566_EDAN008606 [Ephemera danica]|nr:hypothetical protein B566_EDAN008606 [Ephemera danica]
MPPRKKKVAYVSTLDAEALKRKSTVSESEMHNFTSLTAYRHFQEGLVLQPIKTVKFEDDNKPRLLIAKVGHSQRFSEPPVTAWVLAGVDGQIITAHCECKAGLGESCSHAAAIMFAVEYFIRRKGELSVTSVLCAWKAPPVANIKSVPVTPARELDFTSSRQKWKDLNSTDCEDHCKKKSANKRSRPVTPPTAQEMEETYDQLNLNFQDSQLLRYHNTYHKQFVGAVHELPKTFTQLYNSEYVQLPYHELITKCHDDYLSITVSGAQIAAVEEATRKQSKSQTWFLQRAGRVTASKIFDVCHSEPSSPAISLVKSICMPFSHNFKSKATEYGCKHEKIAADLYINIKLKLHEGKVFKHRQPGFFIHEKHPFLGGSPDLIVECDCHGRGVVEIKCPYCVKDDGLNALLKRKDSCLILNLDGKLSLKKNHKYYYQVQMQASVVPNVSYCDFVLYTKKDDLFIDTILPDIDFQNDLITKAFPFFLLAILPEVSANYYTRERINNSEDYLHSPQNVFCFCQKNESPEMVHCKNSDCMYIKFHLSCLHIDKMPKKKFWLCPECCYFQHKKRSSSKTSTTSGVPRERLAPIPPPRARSKVRVIPTIEAKVTGEGKCTYMILQPAPDSIKFPFLSWRMEQSRLPVWTSLSHALGEVEGCGRRRALTPLRVYRTALATPAHAYHTPPNRPRSASRPLPPETGQARGGASSTLSRLNQGQGVRCACLHWHRTLTSSGSRRVSP